MQEEHEVYSTVCVLFTPLCSTVVDSFYCFFNLFQSFFFFFFLSYLTPPAVLCFHRASLFLLSLAVAVYPFMTVTSITANLPLLLVVFIAYASSKKSLAAVRLCNQVGYLLVLAV
ncbi:hypothetical protein O6P43_008847 [Quillaja saponaria]|uniref:Uncharacterized protein n=1 Tax=Quillaja saponaria TaxID=32244 RepID=A0AAD7PX16_QUISA|nr:hypothetical protein O6P43_008847 [Quillaja saponaria]